MPLYYYDDKSYVKNIFVKRAYVPFYGYWHDVPNWPGIIGFTAGVIGIIAIVITAIILRRAWHKKNCFPVQLAGKTAWIRKGGCMKVPSIYQKIKSNWNSKGYDVLGFYTDPGCTKPLIKDAIVNRPVQVFPKIVKKQ